MLECGSRTWRFGLSQERLTGGPHSVLGCNMCIYTVYIYSDIYIDIDMQFLYKVRLPLSPYDRIKSNGWMHNFDREILSMFFL